MHNLELSYFEENDNSNVKVESVIANQQSLYIYSELGEAAEVFVVDFSLLKLGETQTVDKFSKELIKRIGRYYMEGMDTDSMAVCAPPSTIEHAAGLMAAQVATAFAIPMVEITKQKPLGDYSLLNEVSDRESAVRDTMRLRNPDILTDKQVLIIDDVFVTGSVLRELTRALFAGGAEQASIFTVLMLNNQDYSFEGKINEAAISTNLHLLIKTINDGGVITSAFLKALTRMNNQDNESFNKAIAGLHPQARYDLFWACMKYQRMTRGEGGYLKFPDPEFMKIFVAFMPGDRDSLPDRWVYY